MQRVYPGMRFSEARAVCADLLRREYDEKLYLKLQAEVIQRLVLASPQVSSPDLGIFLLDASGLLHLGGESKFCLQLQKLLGTAGFADLHIGLADSAFAAHVASKFRRSRHYIVTRGRDREFLSALSVGHLPLSQEIQESLLQSGIKTIGQLLQIPSAELQERFGREVLSAVDLGSGDDRTRPQMPKAPELYEAFLDLGFPVDSLSQSQFILKSMLERVSTRLKENDLLAEELLVSFFSDSDKFDERVMRLLRPSNNTKFLLEVIKLSLEAQPLKREYTGVNVKVTASCHETFGQNKLSVVESGRETCRDEDEIRHQKKQDKDSVGVIGLIKEQRSKDYAATTFSAELKNTDAQAEPFALLLQRFIARMGAKSLVCPVAADQHIPDMAASFLPVVEDGGAVLPISINYADFQAHPSALACGLILKKSPDPEPVLVEYQGHLPSSITYRGRWHKIKELTEPEKLSGFWWENPVRKSYYVALLETCSEGKRTFRRDDKSRARESADCSNYLVLLVHDSEKNSWQLEGFFD